MKKKLAQYACIIKFVFMHSATIYSADGIPDIIQFKDANSGNTFKVPFKQLTIYPKYKEMKKTFAPKYKGMKEILAARTNPTTLLHISLQKGCRFYPHISPETINDQEVFNNLQLFFCLARTIAPQNLPKQPCNASDIPDLSLAIDYVGLDWDDIIKTFITPFRENDPINDWQPDPFSAYLVAHLIKKGVPYSLNIPPSFKDKQHHQNPLLNYIIREDEHRCTNYEHKQQQRSFLQCVELQHLRTKYRNLIEDKRELYPANIIMEEVGEINRGTRTVISYMATEDVNEEIVARYVKRYIETVVTKAEKPIIIGTWSTRIKLPFLKALAKWSDGGKLSCNVCNGVNESSPPQQEICISCIINGMPKLAVGIGFCLSKKDSQSPTLKHDTLYGGRKAWTLYPNEQDVQQYPSQQNTRDLVMFIQNLEPSNKTPNPMKVTGVSACYWRWCSPPADA